MKTLLCIAALVIAPVAFAAQEPTAELPGDALLHDYFAAEVARIAQDCEAATQPDTWKADQEMRREQLRDMLGLKPWPERGDLHPVITGRIEREDFVVEKLHFQSVPGLYVTGNLYLPKDVSKPAPAILYVCGHSFQIKDGVSFGNKAGYQHHGIWLAQHGYVCLIIDTLQLGEIQGIHHGTYREGRWWWNSRGYTSAGVEAWNSMRALDYLETRPEVDPERFGITGRSGGGAYSWFAAALDQRIKVVAPVAGITDLQNHVVDGTVEGHCDCMFFVNTCRWDYPMLAALVAPRPLLLANSDKDTIFPLDGVLRVHQTLKRIYDGWGVGDRLGLLITEGPHKDTQDLQVPVFRWFNRWLKEADPLIQRAAEKLFDPAGLKVFDELPADEINTRIDELFVPLATEPPVPENADEWAELRDQWMTGLKEKVFHGWPEAPYGSELFAGRLSDADRTVSFLSPFGFGGTAWSDHAKQQTQIRRRVMLLGQTLDGMRVWDNVQAIRHMKKGISRGSDFPPIELEASGDMAMNALLAAIMEPGVTKLVLTHLPTSYRDAPDYLNLARVADVPELLALAAERMEVVLHETPPEVARFANAVGGKLGWKPVVFPASSE